MLQRRRPQELQLVCLVASHFLLCISCFSFFCLNRFNRELPLCHLPWPSFSWFSPLFSFFLFHSQDKHCIDLPLSLPLTWLHCLLSKIVSLEAGCAPRERTNWQPRRKTGRGEGDDWQEKKMEKSSLTERRMWRKKMEWEGKQWKVVTEKGWQRSGKKTGGTGGEASSERIIN